MTRAHLTTTARAALVVLGLGLAGCGEGGAGSAPPEPTSSPAVADGLVPEGYDGSFELVAEVVQGTTGAPAACIGAQAAVGLLPGQRPCGGLELDGWVWEGVEHVTEPDGVRRGTYRITGTVDAAARTMTITAPPVVDTPALPPSEEPDFSTRCPEPVGGWVAPDPSRATFEAQQGLFPLTAQLEGFAGMFVDEAPATASGDPSATVVNILTVGDIAATEAAVREVWGGPLCVSRGVRSEAEVLAAQDAVTALDGLLTAGPDIFAGQYRAEVLIARSEDQAALDAEFGEGVVRLTGALTPVD